MSRACGLWVALKIVTNVADGSGRVLVDSDRITPAILRCRGGKRFEHRITARMLRPDLSELERSREGIRLAVARAYAQANRLNQIESLGGDPQSGSSPRERRTSTLRQALATLGLDETGHRAPRHPAAEAGDDPSADPAEITEFADGSGRDHRGGGEARLPRVRRQADPVRQPVRAPRHRQARCRTAPRCSPATANWMPTASPAAWPAGSSALAGFDSVEAPAQRAWSGQVRCRQLPLVPRTPVLLLRLPAQPLHQGAGRARWSAAASAATRWCCYGARARRRRRRA